MSGADIIARNAKKKKQQESNGNSGGSAIIRRNIENNARNIVFNELNLIRTTQEASQKSAKTRFSYDKEGNRLVSYLSDTKDYLDKVSKDKSEYQKKKDYINYIIKEYGAKISDEDKKTVTDYLNSSANDYNKYYDELEKIAKADHDYFSQWENEEAYNYSVSKAEKQKQYSKMSDDELDAEIEKLGGKSDGILDSIAKGVKKGFKSFALKNLEKDVISLNVPETAKSQIMGDIEDEKNKTSENDSDLALLQKEKINRKIKTLDSLPDNVKKLIEEYTVLDREKEENSLKNDAAVIVAGLTGSGGKYDVDSGRSRREEIANELNSLGVENWNELVEYNRIRRDEDYYKEENNEYAENAKSHPVLTSISTIPASVTKLMGVKKALESAVEDSDVPLNYNSPYFAGNNFVNTTRETVMENYDKHTDTGLEWFDDIDWFDQIYSTAMSTGDSVLNMALTGGTKIGGVVLGATAMSDTAQEVARNGGNKEQALLTGVIAGINEMLWENVSIGQFKSMTEKEIKNLISKKGIKTLAGNVLKSVGVNASEEFNTEVANIIVDYLVNGGLSSYAQAYDAYRQGGYTETEARKKARNDMINQTVMSGVGGAMQGLFMGGAGSALSGIITKSKYNQQANNMTPEEISTLQTRAKELGIKESDINVNVEDVGPWGETGRISEKKLSNLISLVEDAEAENAKINLINEAKKYGIDTTQYNLKNNEGITALYSAIAKTEERMQNEVEQLSDSIYINALKDRLVSLGESESYATYAAENLIRKKNGETLDSYRENSIKTSSAEIAYNELMTVGENAPQWVKDVEAQIDSAGVDLIKTYTRKTTAETSSDVQGETASKGESSTLMADMNPVVSEAAENFAAQMENPQKQEAARRLYIPALDRTTDFKTAFDAYYNAGLKGIGSFEAIDKYYSFAHSFPLYWRKNVFSAGRENKVYNPGVNAFYQSRLTATQKNQIRIMDEIGKKFGISFLVYDRLKDNGEELNGAYLSGTNKILVSLDADGKLYLRTAGHECLHLIEKWNSTEAQKLIEKVVSYLKNSADYDYSARVQWYAQRYNVDANTADGLKLIHSEMAADCMFDVFSNEKFIKDLVEKNRTLAQKLKDVLQNFLKQLRNMMNSFKDSAEMNALREQAEALEDIRSSFHNALRAASEEMQNSLKNEQKNTTEKGDVRYSLKYTDAINQLEKNTLNRAENTHLMVLDHTPQIYIDKAGAKNKKIIMGWDIAYLAMRKNGDIPGRYHNLGPDVMKILPEALQDPLFIVKQNNGRIAAITNVVVKNKRSVMVSIELDAFKSTTQNGQSESDNYNLVVTVMDAQPHYLQNNIFKGDVVYDKNNEGPTHFILRLKSLKKALSNDGLVESSGNILSQNREKSTGNDSKYIDAVNRGDMETAQKLVDEAAAKAGYKIKAYHGTKNAGFTRFEYSPDRQTGDNFGKAYYFTTDYKTAQGYSYDFTKDPRINEYKNNREQLKQKFLETGSEEDKNSFLNYKQDGKTLLEMLNDESYITDGGEVKELFLKIANPLRVDAKGKYHYEVYEQYFKQARKNNHDGIVVKNVIDVARGEHRPIDVYITFNSNQMKSADPVTYDNDGNVIPLSERFKANNKDIRYSKKITESEYSLIDSNGRELSKEQQEYFRDAKTRDKNGRLKPFYHGTGRADRVGSVFDPERATSGPMAFFTDNKEIADNYARDKKDTSIEYDSDYDSYETQFRVNRNGKDMSVVDLWNTLSISERNAIKEKAKHITMDDDLENVIYSEDAQYGLGNFDAYELNAHRGNALHTLVDSWLTDGNIYGEEHKFLDVLKLVGIDDAKYMNPNFRDEKTYQVYLNITNPFDTSNISSEMLAALRKAAENTEFVEGNSADLWDKRNISPERWIERLEDDIENGTTHTWTSIPDFVTDTLKAHGYDGIFDTGGKRGGDIHTVAIPFYSEQIKNVDNLNPTTSNDIRYSIKMSSSAREVLESNPELKLIFENLQNQMKLSEGYIPDRKRIHKFAAELRKNVETTLPVAELENDLQEIYKVLASIEDSEGYEYAWDLTVELSQKMLNNSRVLDDLNAEKKDLRERLSKYLRGRKFYLSPSMKAEIESYYDTYGNFHRKIFGRGFSFSENATATLESEWNDLCAELPELFDPDTHVAEQPIALLEAFNATEWQYGLFDEYQYDSQVQYTATEIMNTLTDIPTTTTLLDRITEKQYNEIASLNSKNLEKIQELKRQYSEDLERISSEAEARYKLQIKKNMEQKKATEVRGQIEKQIVRLSDMLAHGKKNRHIPLKLIDAVRDLCYAVTLNRASQNKLGENLGIIEASYAALNDGKDGPDGELNSQFLKNAYDEYVYGLIKDLGSVLRHSSVANMTLAELIQVNETVKAVAQRVTRANELHIESRNAGVEDTANAIGKELGAPKVKREFSSDVLNNASDKADVEAWKFLKPIYAWRMIGSETFTELMGNIRAGEDTWAVDMQEAKEKIDTLAQKYNKKTWEKGKIEVELSSGTYSFSVQQLMMLYVAQQREQYLPHLLGNSHSESPTGRVGGGFVFEDAYKTVESKKDGTKKKPKVYRERDAGTHTLTENDLEIITEKLTAEQRGYANEMRDYLARDLAVKGNEITRVLYDMNKFTEEKYFPIKVAREFLDGTMKEPEVRSVLSQSMLKDLQEKAANPILLRDFDTVWAEHVQQMAMFHSFALPLDDYQRVFNFRTTKGKATSIKTQIETSCGKGAISYIENFVKDVNGGVRNQNGSELVNTMMSKFKKGAVFASASVTIQQPSAIARALAEVDPKYFTNPTISKKDYEELMKYAPIARIKAMGFFDTSIGQSTVDWLTSEQYSTTKEKIGALLSTKDSSYRDEVLSKAPELMDEITWCNIWHAVKKETAAKTGLSGEELLKASGKRFSQVIELTQVYDSVFSKSELMRSKDTGVKMMTAFMAEPTVSLNMLVDAVIQAKRGNLKGGGRYVGAFVASVILNNILKALVTAPRDDDEEKTLVEKYIAKVIGGIQGDLNPLSLIPIAKDAISIFDGYSVERADMSLVQNLYDAIKDLSSDKKNVLEKGVGVAGALSAFLGVPLKNIFRDMKTAGNLVSGIFTIGDTSADGIKDAVKENSSDSLWNKHIKKIIFGSSEKQIYEAIRSNDYSAYEKLQKNEYGGDSAKVKTAIKAGLVEYDERVTLAAQARLDGDFNSYDKYVRDITKDGFGNEVVVKAVNSVYNELTKSTDSEAESKEKFYSLYTSEDLNNALETGGDYKTVIKDMIEASMKNGSTRQSAESSVKTRIASYWKKVYFNASEQERKDIEKLLDDTGLYRDIEETTSGWVYSVLKEEYIAAESTSERNRIKQEIWKSGYFSTRKKMNDSLEKLLEDEEE